MASHQDCTVTSGMAGPSANMMLICRPELCFWNSVVLYLTLLLAAAQVLATALDTYLQLIRLMTLMIGITALMHFQPFEDPLLQRMQMNQSRICPVTAALYALSPFAQLAMMPIWIVQACVLVQSGRRSALEASLSFKVQLERTVRPVSSSFCVSSVSVCEQPLQFAMVRQTAGAGAVHCGCHSYRLHGHHQCGQPNRLGCCRCFTSAVEYTVRHSHGPAGLGDRSTQDKALHQGGCQIIPVRCQQFWQINVYLFC